MKPLSLAALTLPFLLALGPLSVIAAENPSPAASPTAPAVVSLSELIKDADRFAGQSVTITGRFGGMCADGADFYFKDKLDLIEVIPPPEALPDDVVIGTPLKIHGVVLVRAAHEDAQEHDEDGDEESDIKVRASAIETDRL